MSRASKFVGFLITILSPTFLMAQSADSWTNYRDLDAVKIDYTVQQCGQEPEVITEFYYIKLTNKTAEPVSITFKLEYYYNGSCATCSNDEYRFTFNIPANGTIVPDCALSAPAGRLAVIKRYVNRNFGSPLDRFELSDIVVQ